jgi:hypothetical protein
VSDNAVLGKDPFRPDSFIEHVEDAGAVADVNGAAAAGPG